MKEDNATKIVSILYENCRTHNVLFYIFLPTSRFGFLLKNLKF